MGAPPCYLIEEAGEPGDTQNTYDLLLLADSFLTQLLSERLSQHHLLYLSGKTKEEQALHDKVK